MCSLGHRLANKQYQILFPYILFFLSRDSCFIKNSNLGVEYEHHDQKGEEL